MRMRLALGDGVGGVGRRDAHAASRCPTTPRSARRRRRWVSDAILGEGIGSMLCCPMLTGEKVVGALYVGSRRPREFPPIEVALTTALAAQGAVAIENGRLYAALAEQNRLLEGSFAVHRALTDAALTGAGPRAHLRRAGAAARRRGRARAGHLAAVQSSATGPARRRSACRSRTSGACRCAGSKR